MAHIGIAAFSSAAVPFFAYRWHRLHWTAGLTLLTLQLCKWITLAALMEPKCGRFISTTLCSWRLDRLTWILYKQTGPLYGLVYSLVCVHVQALVTSSSLCFDPHTVSPNTMLVYTVTDVMSGGICSRKSNAIIANELALWFTSL